MFNKFKIGEIVVVKGIGKKNGWFYYERVGTVICKDPYFKDYNIRFKDGSDDWFDEQDIRKEKLKNGNKKYKNSRISKI